MAAPNLPPSAVPDPRQASRLEGGSARLTLERRPAVTPYPLFAIIASAYRDVLMNLDLFARVAALWLMPPLGISMLARALVPRPQGASGEAIVIPLEIALLGLLAILVWILALNAIAVFWQRRLLLGEQPTVLMAPVTGRVLRYMAMIMAVTIVVVILLNLLAYVLATLLAGPAGVGQQQVNMPLHRLLVWIVLAFVLARIHLVLPAIAIGDRTMGIGRSWRLTTGYGVYVLLGILGTAVPLNLAAILLQLLLGTLGAGFGLVGFALATLIEYAQAAVLAAFLALSYRFFTTEIARPHF
jgi:hypothetical protein